MKQTTNSQSSYVCVCARVTEEDFRKIINESDTATYGELKSLYGIGDRCTSCEFEIKDLLDECLTEKIIAQRAAKLAAPPAAKKPAKRVSPFERLLQRLRGVTPEKPKSAAAKKAEPAGPVRETYRTGMFFLRNAEMEATLAVSNLQFPEHTTNPNGEVTFDVKLHGEDGRLLATSQKIRLANNASIEMTAGELFPEVKGDVVGAMYPEFENLVQTGSLRPYAVMINKTPRAGLARCHYHDKFALFTDPGFFQTNSPFEPGETCWMAISNCQTKRYESDYHLKYGDTILDGKLALEPMASRWVKLEELFPGLDQKAPELSPALFWLENPQHVMVYFFWRLEAGNVWMAQHH